MNSMFVVPLLRLCENEDIEVQIKFVDVKANPKAQITFQNLTMTRQNMVISPFAVNLKDKPLQKNYVYEFRLGREIMKKVQPLLCCPDHHFIGIDDANRLVLRIFNSEISAEIIRTRDPELISKAEACFTTYRFEQSKNIDE